MTMKKAHTHTHTLFLGSIRLTPYLLMAMRRISGKFGSVVCCIDKILTRLCFVSWRNTCVLYNGCVRVLPSLQRKQNQTWAIWKWSSETSAWPPLWIYQHVCWSTPQSTAKPFKSNIYKIKETCLKMFEWHSKCD